MTTGCKCIAVCRDHGPRQVMWAAAFGQPEIPIRGPEPVLAEIAGQECRVYLLDLTRVRHCQLLRFADGLGTLYRMPLVKVLLEMVYSGVPIRADRDVYISSGDCPVHQAGPGRRK